MGNVWWAVGVEAQARDVNAGDILLLMFETVRPGEKEQGKGQCIGDPSPITK